jgi:tetratricopeptide (TPR) repeat protein
MEDYTVGIFDKIFGQREKTEKSPGDTTTEVTVEKTDGSVVTTEMSIDNAKRMEDAYTHAYKGINLEKQGKWYEAIEEHKKSIALSFADDPNRAIYFTNLGVCYAHTGKIDMAFEHLETAVRLDPSYKRACDNLEALRDLN